MDNWNSYKQESSLLQLRRNRN